MKAIKSLIATCIVSLAVLSSCGNAAKNEKGETTSPSLEKFTNDKTAARQILFLRIVDEAQTDSSHVYVAKSVFELDTVGLKIEVLKNIIPGVNGQGRPTEEGFVKGAIKFSSIGSQSDAFVKSLASIFNTATTGTFASNTLLPTVFSSNTVTVDLSKKATYSFKLFFDNTVGEPAEIFATLDLYKRSFEISEKDSSYRASLVSALEGK